MSIDIRKKTCFFTGHRTLDEKRVRPILRKEIEKAYIDGYRFFGAGGAIGFDLIASEEVLYLKRVHYPDIRLILVLPYPNYRSKWSQEDIVRMNNVMQFADKIVYVRDFYTKDSYLVRNRKMADGSSRCICYQTKNTGGTSYTIGYVENLIKQGYPYDVINVANKNQ